MTCHSLTCQGVGIVLITLNWVNDFVKLGNCLKGEFRVHRWNSKNEGGKAVVGKNKAGYLFYYFLTFINYFDRVWVGHGPGMVLGWIWVVGYKGNGLRWAIGVIEES